MSQTRVSIARVVRAYSFRVIASKGFWGWLRKKYPNGVPNPRVRSSRLKDTITVATLKRNAERGDKDSIRVVERERWAYEHERMSQAERERHEQTHNLDEELFHPGRARDFESLVKRGKQIRRDPLFESGDSAHDVDIITLALPGAVGEQEFIHKRARFEEDLRTTIRPGTLAQREQAAFGLDAVLGGETVVPATFFAGDPKDPNYGGVQLEEDGMDLYEGFVGDHRNNPQPVDFGSYQGFLSNARTLREARLDLKDRDAFVFRDMTNPNNLFHNPSLERMFFLDVVLGNDDRHVSNVMVRDEDERGQELKDIHFSAIDNGLTLPSEEDYPGFDPQDTGPLAPFRKFMFKRPSKALQERFKKVSLEDAARVIQKAGIREYGAIRGALNRLAALKANPHALRDYTEKSGGNAMWAWQRFHSDSFNHDFLETLGNSPKLDDQVRKLMKRYPPKDGYLEYRPTQWGGRKWVGIEV